MAETVRLSVRKQPRQKRAQATVEAILQATAHILVKEGYEALTTNRVATVAGVSIGSLYQYFPSKEALVTALVDQHCTQMLELLGRTVAELSDAPVHAAVRVFVKAMLEVHAFDPQLHQVFAEQLPRLAGFQKVREINNHARALVLAYLEAHREEIRPRDLDMAAFLVVYTVEAATHAANLEGMLTHRVDALASEISELVLRYLLKAPPGSMV